MRIELVKIEALIPFDKNPRKNEQAVDAVARSIQAFGFNSPIIVGADNRICAGHSRWKAAKKLGLETVPVIKIPTLSGEKFTAFNIADNQIASIAEWENDLLAELLDELKTAGANFADLGFTEKEFRAFFKDDEDRYVSSSVNPSDAAAMVQAGDLIKLDKHRLLCGDARSSSSVERLIGGRKIRHIFAGPPYFNQRTYSQWKSHGEYVADMRLIMQQCFAVAARGTVIAWNIASGSRLDHISHNSIALEQEGFEYLDTIAWVKSGANFDLRRNCHISTTGRYYPALQWEAILVYKKPGSMPIMDAAGKAYMKNHQTNVWEVRQVIKQSEKIGHPAVCPIEIPYRSMQAYSRKGHAVYDPFGGSGTTLLAAEKAGRRAFLMEQHPAYCDIIIRRWEEMTGGKAEIIERGSAKSDRAYSTQLHRPRLAEKPAAFITSGSSKQSASSRLGDTSQATSAKKRYISTRSAGLNRCRRSSRRNDSGSMAALTSLRRPSFSSISARASGYMQIVPKVSRASGTAASILRRKSPYISRQPSTGMMGMRLTRTGKPASAHRRIAVSRASGGGTFRSKRACISGGLMLHDRIVCPPCSADRRSSTSSAFVNRSIRAKGCAAKYGIKERT